MTALDDDTLVAYVDGELDSAAAGAVERRLAADPVARDKVLMLGQSAALVRAACSAPVHETVPQRLLDAIERPPRARPRVRGAVAAAVVAGCLGLAGGWVARGVGAGAAPAEDLVTEIAAYHAVLASDEGAPVVVPAAQVGRLEAWTRTHLRRPLVIPDLADRGLRFRGGRLLVADARPVVQLVYTAPGRPAVAVCMARERGAARPPRVDHAHGYTLVSWRRGDTLYVVIGAADAAYLRALAAEIAPQLGRT